MTQPVTLSNPFEDDDHGLFLSLQKQKRKKNAGSIQTVLGPGCEYGRPATDPLVCIYFTQLYESIRGVLFLWGKYLLQFSYVIGKLTLEW